MPHHHPFLTRLFCRLPFLYSLPFLFKCISYYLLWEQINKSVDCIHIWISIYSAPRTASYVLCTKVWRTNNIRLRWVFLIKLLAPSPCCQLLLLLLFQLPPLYNKSTASSPSSVVSLFSFFLASPKGRERERPFFFFFFLRQQIIKTQVARLFLCLRLCVCVCFKSFQGQKKRERAAYCGFSLTRGFRRQSQAPSPPSMFRKMGRKKKKEEKEKEKKRNKRATAINAPGTSF